MTSAISVTVRVPLVIRQQPGRMAVVTPTMPAWRRSPRGTTRRCWRRWRGHSDTLLAQLGGLLGPVIGNLASLDRRPLRLRFALLGRGQDRRFDDLSAHRQVAAGPQRGIEAGKQHIHRSRSLERLGKVQIVLASGTASARPRPRKRMIELRSGSTSRSLTRYSALRPTARASPGKSRTLNFSTRSKAGRQPLLPSDRGTARSNFGRNGAKSTRAVIRSRSMPFATSPAGAPTI